MEKSIHALPKWHWKFIASVLLFGNHSRKHGRWKQLVHVYTGTQRIKTQEGSAQLGVFAALWQQSPDGEASEQWFLWSSSGFSCSAQAYFTS